MFDGTAVFLILPLVGGILGGVIGAHRSGRPGEPRRAVTLRTWGGVFVGGLAGVVVGILWFLALGPPPPVD